MKYLVTKKQCQENINKLNNVCDRCGRKIVPIRTVDNANRPTFWAGCMHGTKGDDASGHFTQGVSKEVFNLAENLVLDDSYYFEMDYEEAKLSVQYAYFEAIYRTCDAINRIERMKTGKPRNSKQELFERYGWISEAPPVRKKE